MEAINGAKYRRRLNIWRVWSVSKLVQLYHCPLAFYFQYLVMPKIPQNPFQSFGEAVHYMLQRFFAVNFKTPESFAKSWVHFWFGVCDGKHGTKGYNAPAVEINFQDFRIEPGQLGGKGIEVMKKFYEANIKYKKKGLIPQTEKSFRVDFCGISISGQIDRIQPYPDGKEEIWDYKPRLPTKTNMRTDVQLTLYNLAYNKLFDKTLKGLRIYNYNTAQTQWLPPRSREEQYVELYEWLKEAQSYVWGVLFWQKYQVLPFQFTLEQFRNFNTEDIKAGIFSPRWLPNGHPCKFCNFFKLCEAWRKQKIHQPIFDELRKNIQPPKPQLIQQREFTF